MLRLAITVNLLQQKNPLEWLSIKHCFDNKQCTNAYPSAYRTRYHICARGPGNTNRLTDRLTDYVGSVGIPGAWTSWCDVFSCDVLSFRAAI